MGPGLWVGGLGRMELVIFVNFKVYQSGIGERAVEMVRVMEGVAKETGVAMVPVVQVVDGYRVAQMTGLPVWVQHVDGIEVGAHTGWVLPEAVREAGVAGTVLNHAERKFESWKLGDFGLEKTVERCREVGLRILVCADGLEEVRRVLELRPDYLAYEPPELIGSSEVSVVSRPGVISEVVKLAGEVPVIVGAGVHVAEDIKKGLELGAKGFLVASAVMKSWEPEVKLKELADGYLE